MARNPYSQQFLVYTDSSPSVLYEVPPGYLADIRQVTAYSEAAIGGLTVSIQDSGEAPACIVVALVGAAAPWYQAWEGRVVVPSQGFISIAWSGASSGLNAYVGGFLLADNLP